MPKWMLLPPVLLSVAPIYLFFQGDSLAAGILGVLYVLICVAIYGAMTVMKEP